MRTIEGQIFIRTKGAETVKLSLVEVQLFDVKAIVEDMESKRKAAASIDGYLQALNHEATEAERHAEEVYKRLSSAGQTDAIDAAAAAHTEAGLRSIDVQEKAYYPRSADYYFSDLPKPLQTTKTDADGKFAFQIPVGSYALAAISSREAGEETEKYHWMIKVTADVDKKVMLANDNLSSSGSPDSIVATLRYAPWEYSAYGAKLKFLTEQTGIAEGRAEGYLEQKLTSEAKIRYLKAQLVEPPLRNLQTLAAFVEQDKQKRNAAEAAKKQSAETAQKEAAAAAAAEVTKKEAAAAAAAAAEGAKKEMERQDELEIFRKNPKAAQRKAIELYPDLSVAGSPLNKEFVERTKRYQTEKKAFFAEPDWPVRLAKECSEALAAKPVPK